MEQKLCLVGSVKEDMQSFGISQEDAYVMNN